MTDKLPFPIHSRVVAYLRDSGGESQELYFLNQSDSSFFVSLLTNSNICTIIYKYITSPAARTLKTGRITN